MLLHKSVEFDSRVRREASSLAAAGHDVVVLELAPVPPEARRLDGFARRSVLPGGRPPRRRPLRLERAAMVGSFVRATVQSKPDVVHAHDAAMLVPGIVGARLARARLVYDTHELATGVPYRERGWALLVRAIERLIAPRGAAVITVSDGIADRLQELYPLRRRPAVIRNVTALQAGGAGGLRSRLGIGSEVPLVLHQGAPAPDRGCEQLVEAVARLDGVWLAFLGDPEPGYEERLSRLIDLRGVGDRVRQLPSVRLEDLLANTAEADVGVTLLQDTCENHRLALPNKLFEYVAAGIPVVAAALPETQRLVERYGIGWCVRPDDPEALADALGTALASRDDDALRARITAAAAELRWHVEQSRLIELYDGLGS